MKRNGKRYPALQPLYHKMRQICDLLNHKGQSKRSCRHHVRELLRHIDDLKAVGFKQLKTLARTLASWAEPIAAMWRFRKSNSIIPHMRDLPPKNETHSAPRIRLPQL
jgi:hypothetical protein